MSILMKILHKHDLREHVGNTKLITENITSKHDTERHLESSLISGPNLGPFCLDTNSTLGKIRCHSNFQYPVK